MMRKLTSKKISKHSSGFTLIEVLVSLSIFTMVVTAAVAALLSVITVNARTQNVQSVMTNLGFAVDSMSREIRTGNNYYCESGSSNLSSISNNMPTSGNGVSNCDNGDDHRYAISFREGGNSLTRDCSGDRVAYRYNPNDLSIERRLCDGSWHRMTSDMVEIENLTFTVTGTDSVDNFTPSVTIYVAGRVLGVPNADADFAMQTSVSQYLLDL